MNKNDQEKRKRANWHFVQPDGTETVFSVEYTGDLATVARRFFSGKVEEAERKLAEARNNLAMLEATIKAGGLPRE